MRGVADSAKRFDAISVASTKWPGAARVLDKLASFSDSLHSERPALLDLLSDWIGKQIEILVLSHFRDANRGPVRWKMLYAMAKAREA